jgi:hypothetical protein
MTNYYYAQMTEGELVGHVLALADDASELSQVLALRLRAQTKMRQDAEMRAQIAQERIYRLEREIRELKMLAEKM